MSEMLDAGAADVVTAAGTVAHACCRRSYVNAGSAIPYVQVALRTYSRVLTLNLNNNNNT